MNIYINRLKFIRVVGVIFLAASIAFIVFINMLCLNIMNSLTARSGKKYINAMVYSSNYTYKEVEFKSAYDSVKLKGTLFISKKPSNKTVILVHGYLQDKNICGYTSIISNNLSQLGYNILAFDLRAHGESDGSTITFGYLEKYDIIGAVNYIKSIGYIGKKVAVLGFSMGAASAIEAASIDDRIDTVIADSAYSDLKLCFLSNVERSTKNISLINQKKCRALWKLIQNTGIENFVIRSISRIYKININDISPSNYARNIKDTPFLLIHGKRDELVPFDNSKTILKSLSSNPNVQIWITEDAGHMESISKYRSEYLKRISLFLSNNI